MPPSGNARRLRPRPGSGFPGRVESGRLKRRLARLPRVELHLHLEGSVSLGRLRRLWERAGRDPSLPSDPAILYHHRTFPEFLRHFAQLSRAIRAPEDLGEIVGDLARALRRQGVVAAEVFFSPVIFTRRGLPFPEMLDAIEEAARQSTREGGPDLRWILDGVRQWGPQGFEELLDCARAGRGRVLGVGLGGDERSVPAGQFAGLFEEARRMGLKTVAHAGEFDSARSVRDAVEVLGAERIGHGIRSVEDPGVVGLLRRRRIPLEVCPTSNLRTGVVRRWREHPLPRLVRSRLRITLNSDDPSLFRTSLSGEYIAAHRRLGLSGATLFRIHLEAIRASFLPIAKKRRLEAASRRIWRGKAEVRPARKGLRGGQRRRSNPA